MKTPRTSVRRKPDRGSYDFEVLARILDEAFLCQIGFVVDGQPYVIPTSYGRDDRTLYIHGSPASRMLRYLRGGVPTCLTVTLVDGLVLARSVFHHSVNYRSVMVLGPASPVEGDEKLHALRVITNHMVPGRWDDARAPTERELKATTVLRLDIEEASAKVREGPPIDEEEDRSLPYWAGVLPLALVPGGPVPEPGQPPTISTPAYVSGYKRGRLSHA